VSSVIVSRYLASELARIGADISMVEPLLPKAVKDMVSRMGYQSAMQVVSKVGGTSFLVPMPAANHGDLSVEARRKLDEALGSETLGALLRKYYGGSMLYIPSCATAMRTLRDIAIHKFTETGLDQGRSMNSMVSELAIKFGLSDRRIWEILKTLNPAELLQPSIPGQSIEVSHAIH
jgi:Mor family transcriptional regulator